MKKKELKKKKEMYYHLSDNYIKFEFDLLPL